MDSKKLAILTVSLLVAVFSISVIIATVVMRTGASVEDPGRDKERNSTFGQNVEVRFLPDEGLEIVIHNDIGEVLFKSLFNMYKGYTSEKMIKICELELDKLNMQELLERLDAAPGAQANQQQPPGGAAGSEGVERLLRRAAYCIEVEGKAKFMTHPMINDEWDIACQSFSWEALDCREDEFEVCFDMLEQHWYGAAQVRQQRWPINAWQRPMSPFVNGDSFQDEYGGVLHRYFLSSAGSAITVEWDVPLWVSFNETGNSKMCLKGRYKDSPYNNYDDTPLYFNYTQCNGFNIRRVHEFMVDNYLKTPIGIPDEALFRYPIWSTWAQYHKDINESIVLGYASDILRHNFSIAQLEIDDKWELQYGDLQFDPAKFPDPAAMVNRLSDMGIRTTLWVHPFAQVTSDLLNEAAVKMHLVRDPGHLYPAFTSWWNGVAGILDFTNNRTKSEYQNRLRRLQSDYNISSFKFDAGEVNWLPAAYSLTLPSRNPSKYTNHFASAAYEVDPTRRNLEVRVGARTQHLPVFVRMMDKLSTWDYDMGLKSVIPTALTFSVLGYPFILPDMIGGNAYNDVEPDRELYIRWIEVNVFLPGFQFSIPPWHFDDEVVAIAQRMLRLHESYADVMIELAHHAVATGDPIIRPLWWIDTDSEDAFTSDSQFLVGSSILVAPVVEQGATSRDVYVPTGVWHDVLRDASVTGPTWLYNYTVELDELAYFLNMDHGHDEAEKHTSDL